MLSRDKHQDQRQIHVVLDEMHFHYAVLIGEGSKRCGGRDKHDQTVNSYRKNASRDSTVQSQ